MNHEGSSHVINSLNGLLSRGILKFCTHTREALRLFLEFAIIIEHICSENSIVTVQVRAFSSI